MHMSVHGVKLGWQRGDGSESKILLNVKQTMRSQSCFS